MPAPSDGVRPRPPDLTSSSTIRTPHACVSCVAGCPGGCMPAAPQARDDARADLITNGTLCSAQWSTVNSATLSTSAAVFQHSGVA